MKQKQVRVIDTDGKLLGYVAQSATSICASKIAKGECHFERRGGEYCWVKI